jgi:transposase
VITLRQKQRIILKHINGMSNRSIAAELHMSKDTVNKYVNEYEQKKAQLLLLDPAADTEELIQAIVEKPRYNSAGRKPVKVTPDMLADIEQCLKINEERRLTGLSKQQMKKIDIYEHLVNEKKYDISYSSVRKLVKSIEDRHREAFIRQEYELGEVCEFDWGTAKLDIGGTGYKKYQMAVFTPAKSNYRYSMLYRNQDTNAFQEAHAEFFHHCRGRYQVMVYDNMRVAIKRFVGPHEKEPTASLMSLSMYYGFSFRFANIYCGNEKGHVERSVEYVRRKAFSEPGKDRFDTLAEANRYLLAKCLALNSREISNGTVPLEIFKEEQKHLLAHLPKFESCMYSDHRVDKYATVVVCQNHYSVPDTLVGKMVDVKRYTNKVKIYYDHTLVAEHERSCRPHDWIIDIRHYLRTLYKKPGALRGSTALLQADTRIKNIYRKYYSNDAKTFLQVLGIIYEKGVKPVENALDRLETVSPLDMSADKVRVLCDHLQEQETRTASVCTDALTEKTRSTLGAYDRLAQLQSQKPSMEAI